MNREIKFRAYHNGKMEWYLTITKEGECIYSDLIRSNYNVMQWTGLKDKNGLEIYEGDILEIGSLGKARKEIVEYESGGFEYNDENIGYQISHNANRKIVENAEVIGNIYENPELK